MFTSRREIPSIWIGHRLSEEVRRVGESYEKVDGESSDDLPDPVGQPKWISELESFWILELLYCYFGYASLPTDQETDCTR